MQGWLQLNAQFLSQFTAADGTFLYRHNRTGPAYRVTGSERDALLAAFKRRIAWAIAASFAAFVVVPFGLLVPAMTTGALPPTWFAFAHPVISLVLCIGAVLVAVRWAYQAPLSFLEARRPELPALSKDERDQARFAGMSYGRLALAPLIYSLLTVLVLGDYALSEGYGRLVWLLPLFGTFDAAYSAWQKWQFDRRQR